MTTPKTPFPTIIAAQYFIHFAVMGVFLPYFNLYCYHIGLDGVQIGLISSVRSLTNIIFPLFWGILADRLKQKKLIYVGCCFISSFVWCGFFMSTEFIVMLMISIIYGIFYAPIISFLEALTVDVLGPEKQSYGKIRVWGSIAFILMVMIMGKIIGRFSISVILIAIFMGSFIQSFLSMKLPFRTASQKPASGSGIKEFITKRTLVFLFAAFLMLVSHGGYYGFFSIHMEELGYGTFIIGLAWALASCMEIISMVSSNTIFKHFSLERVLIFSFFVAGIRWMILFFITSAPLILLSQFLHAITYGTFHMASILYIDRQSPDHLKTLGQSINNAVTYGMGLMVGFLINGYFFEMFGSKMLFVISSGIAFFAGILFLGFVVTDKRR